MQPDPPTHDALQDQKLAHILRTIDNKPESPMSPVEPEKASQARSDFWMKVAAISFGLWSLAVGMAIKSITDFQTQFSTYVLLTERRITLLEERQAIVLKRLDRLNEQPYPLFQPPTIENRNGNR
jgi:hypothetical protein